MSGFWAMVLTMLAQIGVSGATYVPPVIAPALMPAMGLSFSAVGYFAVMTFLSAAVTGVYAVAMVRRHGPIRTCQFALLLAAIGSFLMALLQPWALYAGGVLIGAGLGQLNPASSDILARTATPHRRALVFSIKQTGVPVAGALVGLASPFTVVHFGPVWALVEIGVLCLVAMVGLEPQRATLDTHRLPDTPWPSLRGVFAAPMLAVLRHPALRVLCVAVTVFSMVQNTVTAFLVSHLSGSLGWTLVEAGAGFSIALVAGVIGRIIWSLIADRIGDGLPVLCGLSVAIALCAAAMVWPGPVTPHWPVLVLVILFGATAVGWNGVYLAQVAREVPQAEVALATVGTLFFSYLAVLVGPLVYTAIATAGGTGVAYLAQVVPLVAVTVTLGAYLWRRRARR